MRALSQRRSLWAASSLRVYDFESGQDLPPEAWVGRKCWDRPDAYFRREDVLVLFPEGAEQPALQLPKPLTRNKAHTFAADYIATEKCARRRPTSSGLEASASSAGYHGGREYLREAFRKLEGASRGRPKKSPAEVAKK